MLRAARETVPIALVPLAWGFAAAAHTGTLGRRPLLVGHVVIAALVVAFALLSWRDMSTGVLRAWRAVLVVGGPVTAAAALALTRSPPPRAVLAAVVVVWLAAPGVAMVYTGRHPDVADGLPLVYLGGGVASLAAAAGYVLAATGTAAPALRLTALAVGGAAQTAAIADAVLRY